MKEYENARMVGFFAGVCGISGTDALGTACHGCANLNVPVVQRRVSAGYKKPEARLNVEYRTRNFQFRSIDERKNIEGKPAKTSTFKTSSDIRYFAIRHSLFDIRYSF